MHYHDEREIPFLSSSPIINFTIFRTCKEFFQGSGKVKDMPGRPFPSNRQETSQWWWWKKGQNRDFFDMEADFAWYSKMPEKIPVDFSHRLQAIVGKSTISTLTKWLICSQSIK